jgi:hypothetical protein
MLGDAGCLYIFLDDDKNLASCRHRLRLRLEDVQYLAGHADPRTTRLYDRRQRTVTRNIVERISI